MFKRLVAVISVIAVLTGIYSATFAAELPVNDIDVKTNVSEENKFENESELEFDVPGASSDISTDSGETPDEMPTSSSDNPAISEETISSEVTKDLSDLVYIPDDWTNSLDKWKTDVNASLYYKVSDYADIDWGSYSDATAWTDGNDLDEGSHYICFWAVFPDEDCDVAISNIWNYKLDTSEPNDFNIVTENKKIDSKNVLVISSGNTVSDSISGIKAVYYAVDDSEYVQLDSDELIFDEYDNIIGFSFEFRDTVENSKITVLVEDYAGNSYYKTVNDISNDSDIPQITEANIVKKDENGESTIKYLTFGDENSNDINHKIFANENDSLKISIKEDNLKEIVVTANDKDVKFTFKDWECIENKNSEEKMYYIPLSKLALEKNIENTLIIKASDEQSESDEFLLRINDDIKCTLIYDENIDESDCNTIFTSDGSIIVGDDIYFAKSTDEQNNGIKINVSDDVGISKYQVILKNKYAGTKTEEREPNKSITDANGIIKDDSYFIAINDIIENQGYNELTVIVTDLAGNIKTSETYSFCIDTISPCVKDGNMVYYTESAVLKYFSFGVFGKETVYTKILIDETGSGIKPENVILYLNSSDDMTKSYTSYFEDGYYVFKLSVNDVNGNDPCIVMTDNCGNSNTYYIESEKNSEGLGKLSVDKQNIKLVIEDEAPTVEVTPTGTFVKGIDRIYFRKTDSTENNIKFSVSDNIGLEKCSIKVYKKTDNTESDNKPLIDDGDELSDKINDNWEYNINVTDFESGDYRVILSIADLSGNDNTEELKEFYFSIDNEAPIVDGMKYTVTPSESELSYFPFGIYGNDNISISINVNDTGVGVDTENVILYWAPKSNDEYTAYKAIFGADNTYTFEKLPFNSDGVAPYITVSDKLGNMNKYYFTDKSGMLSQTNSGMPLILENKNSDVEFIPIGTFESNQNESIPYFRKADSKNKIKITISNSIGLYNYDIKLNGEDLNTADSSNTYTKEKIDNKEYILDITDKLSGMYEITVTGKDLTKKEFDASYVFYIDNDAPIIDDLKYSIIKSDESKAFNCYSFGMYSNDNVSVSINVTDTGIGVDDVILYWAPKSNDGYTAYKAVSDTDGNYVFKNLPFNADGIAPYIIVSDKLGNNSEFYFTNEYEKLSNKNLNTTLILESEKPNVIFTPSGCVYQETETSDPYFRKVNSETENKVKMVITDNVGLHNYSITLNGKDLDLPNSNNEYDDSAEFTSNVTDMESGKYEIKVIGEDLAGNSFDESYVFYIDNDAPAISNCTYTVEPSILKYLTFGIFDNKSISITVTIEETGVGIDNKDIVLYWASKSGSPLKAYNVKSNTKGKYTFEALPINNEAVPYVSIKDKLGNENTYYFDSNSKKMIESYDTNGNRATLVLEDDKPNVTAKVLSEYKGYSVKGEMWYSGNIKYSITASDADSGLNKVSVEEKGKSGTIKTYNETLANGVDFSKVRFNGDNTADYVYDAANADKYEIKATAWDNAGNSKNAQTLKFNIDKNDPEISMFKFGEQSENGSTVIKESYGYYFMAATEVKVYVSDPGVTSGIKSVTLFLPNINGTNANQTVDGASLKTDTSGTYAYFVIPMGFKGMVSAKVIDNVEHESSKNAYGSIIEDNAIHNNSNTSSIDIDADISTDKFDAAGAPLYNRSIPLTITVKDSFSGIGSVEWSIADDGESGIIEVANDGTYKNNSSADIKSSSIVKENNLVTSMQFSISVDSNTNGNIIKVLLRDRAGNTSESTKIYSIDITSPVITSSLGNTAVENESCYKAAQVVNVFITERNFNGNDVVITLNGAVQNVSWDDVGASVGTDSSMHSASFSVSADGDYTYEISYTDRAGNAAVPYSSEKFTVDMTNPTADISFNIGDANLDNAYYNQARTAIFSVVEHNFSTAKITILKDGVDVSGSYSLNNWSSSGDNHVQNVVLSDNGYYRVSIEVTDMAGNQFSTESKNFYIDTERPKVSISVANVANGEPSNEKNIEPSILVNDSEGNLDPDTVTLKITAIKQNAEHEIVPDIQTYIGLDEWRGSSIGKVNVDNEFNPNSIIFSLANLKDDGIYTFEVTASDKAGNTGGVTDEDKSNGAKYKLSVNRLGSTYEVDSKISEISPELRYFRNKKNTLFSFTITEYNVNQLNQNKTVVNMTCDGTVIDNDIVASEDTGTDKWSKYVYEFPSELMRSSGKYIIKLYSEDIAGNENPISIDEDDERATVTFFIDNDDPTLYFRDADDKTEFKSNEPYKTDNKHIEVEVYDNSLQEAQNVVFKLNDTEITPEHKEGSMIYTLTIPNSASAQNLSVHSEDIVGNSVDREINNFLVTTNFFILWLKNTPIFIATIAFVLVLAGGITWIIIKKNHKSK